MAPIVTTVEIARPPQGIFDYVIDLSRFVEWQEGVVSGRMESDGPHGVGSRCISTRRIGGGERASTAERAPSQLGPTALDGPTREAQHGDDER